MALLTMTRRILGSILTPFRTLTSTPGPARFFKDISSIKCNAFVRTRRQSVIRFRKGSCRPMSESCHTRSKPLEGIYFCMKPVRVLTSQYFSYRPNSRYLAPISRYSGFPGMEKKKLYPMETQWRPYAQNTPENPDSKGFTISGVGIRKIDTTNERGYFPRTSKARIDQIKQMLKDKAMLKGTDDVGKKKPK